MARGQVSFLPIFVREAFEPYVMWGDLESAFKITSILLIVLF